MGERRLMNTDWDRLTNTDWQSQSTDWEKEIEMSRSEERRLMNTEWGGTHSKMYVHV